MKKYLLALALIALFALTGYYLIYIEGVFLPTRVELTVPFRTEGEEYQRLTESGTYENIRFKGVDISASIPGAAATQYAPNQEDYLRWLTAIGEMGANMVRTMTIMDDDFYNALYAYNTTHEEPIYLLHGTSVSDYANSGAQDAYAKDFYGELVSDGRRLVDIIHGRKNIILNAGEGTGIYRRDISQWVVGWLIGTDWDPDVIVYTDHRTIYSSSYEGTYFTTTEDSSIFEALIASVMDEITQYEATKYGVQRPIGVVNSQLCDFLEFKEAYSIQLSKYAYLDGEHILSTEQHLAGQFAAYSLLDFCDNYAQVLTDEMLLELAPALARIPEDAMYGGYLYLMEYHHTMPVLVAGYGFSSGRNPLRVDVEPLTETEQGEHLMAVYEEAMKVGWNGVCISTWQDTWERLTWNNAFSQDITTNNLWHDLQSDSQHYGLMRFIPNEIVCMLDGNADEWQGEAVLLQKDGIQLSVRYDMEAVYLLLQGEVSQEQTLYIPIDMTGKSGSTVCEEPALSFSRAADFILCIDGEENTRLLVQERYNAMRENFSQEAYGINPFIREPDADDTLFSPVMLVVRNPYLLNEYDWEYMPQTEKAELTRLGVYETGKLKLGSWDPKAENYSTLADICFGEGCVEIRLPWNMLNVGDPAEKHIHDDYYKHYGVKMQRSDGIWFGLITDDSDTADEMVRYDWKKWRSISYQEHLKDSYAVIQSAWR